MSRYKDNYNNFDFLTKLNEFNELANSMIVNYDENNQEKYELTRFIKVINYLESKIDHIDPELMPLNTVTEINNRFSDCQQHLNNNDTINANLSLDSILLGIQPFIYSTPIKKRGVTYSNRIENMIQSTNDKSNKIFDNFESKSEDLIQKIEASKDKLERFQQELFGSDEDEDEGNKEGIKFEIEEHYRQIAEKATEISSYHEKLLIGSNSIKYKITQLNDDINKTKEIAEEKVNELQEYHNEVFGKEDEETGELSGGQKEKFAQLMSDMETFKQEQDAKYNELNKQIESLLPGATSVGLASAYSEMKNSFDEPILNGTLMFKASIALMLGMSMFFILPVFNNPNITGSWSLLLGSLLYKAPFYLPIIWLAFYASSRRSEAERLRQEYAHKEAIAKSYDSYKLQIKNLQGDSEELLKKLLGNAIDAISYNASVTLEKKHGDTPPLQKIVEAIKLKKN